MKHMLILASWYPSRVAPHNGDFIQRIAEKLSKNYRVTVVHTVNHSEAPFISIKELHAHFSEWIIYNQKSNLPFYTPFKAIVSTWGCIRKIRRRKGQIDFCHVQVIWYMGIVAWLLKKWRGIPYYITEHWTGYMPRDYGLQHPMMRFISKVIAAQSSGIAAVSASLTRHLQHTLSLSNTPMVIPNVVAYASVSSIVDPPSDMVTFVHASNYREEQKNVSGIIRAFSKAVRQCPNIRLHLIGKDLDATMEEYLRMAGDAAPYIHVAGICTHQEVLDDISRADALISFSRFETFALTCAEAITAGTPVIYTACGGPEEYLSPENGMKVPVDDEDALAHAMLLFGRRQVSFDREKIRINARQQFNDARFLEDSNTLYQMGIQEQ
jgi:L-malate glycosyltransferase